MSDDLRDYCECDECRKARRQLRLHSERKRKEREAVEALAVRFKLLPSKPSDETCGTCGGAGQIEVEVQKVGHGCCGRFLNSGECCGNAVPVPVPSVDVEPCPVCTPKESQL